MAGVFPGLLVAFLELKKSVRPQSDLACHCHGYSSMWAMHRQRRNTNLRFEIETLLPLMIGRNESLDIPEGLIVFSVRSLKSPLLGSILKYYSGARCYGFKDMQDAGGLY